MTILIFENDAYDRDKIKPHETYLTLRVNNQTGRVVLVHGMHFSVAPVEQAAAKELMRVEDKQCPNAGKYSQALHKTFHWRHRVHTFHGMSGTTSTVADFTEETCLVCGYTNLVEGNPNLIASFHPGRGGHSEDRHPDRTYMVAPEEKMPVLDATYSSENDMGLNPRENKGTLGFVFTPRLIMEDVKGFMAENFPNATILDVRDTVTIFQDGPTGYE